jgi:hypothetical protein
MRRGRADPGSAFVHAPVGFTKWPCTSKMNSSPSIADLAAKRSSDAYARQL